MDKNNLSGGFDMYLLRLNAPAANHTMAYGT